MGDKKNEKEFSEKLGYSVSEALPKTPLGRNAFYRAVAKGEIPSITIGGKIIILRKPFEKMFG